MFLNFEGWGGGDEPGLANASVLSFLTHIYPPAVNLFCSAYRKSGHLSQDYLRFLWMHREIDPPATAVVLADSEFKSIISTMARLLVMYTSRGVGNLVVPARLPEYGPESVMSPGNIGEVVVEMKCSFGQIYPPPGIVGRFLAWSARQIGAYGECWQHGAFFRYTYQGGQHEVFLYESEDEESREDGTAKFAGLTLGAEGLPAQARNVLAELRASLEQLVADSAYGYPGLTFSMSFGAPVEIRSNLRRNLRALLDNVEGVVDRMGEAVDRLELTASKLGEVANQLLEQELLAASAKRKEYPYPRLVILVPDSEESGAQERIQRVGWDRWTTAWESLHLPDIMHHRFRLRFLCEHNLAEVRCGPGGRGYPIENLKDWVKQCAPLMQVSVRIGSISSRRLCGRASPRQDIGSCKLRSFRFSQSNRVGHNMHRLISRC